MILVLVGKWGVPYDKGEVAKKTLRFKVWEGPTVWQGQAHHWVT